VEQALVADARLARDLATDAGRILLSLRSPALSPDELRATGDAASQERLASRLRRERPGDAVLSEEAADDPSRLAADRVWIVDPLDGTREYSEIPRDDWAVHVALWERGRLVAGAVALPARDVTYATDVAVAAPAAAAGRVRLAVSRTRPPDFVAALAQRLDADLVPMGSAGVKAVAVLTDEVDAYVHAGGQYEWDSAAPVAVCAAAGLHTSRVDGSPLQYNCERPWLPDLLVCKPSVAQRVLDGVRDLAERVGVP
jgi:3'(2'), 5'-bisphosphate nucleotidase